MLRSKLVSLSLAYLLSASVIGAGTAQAYEQYSENSNSTYCRACHGDFEASPYISLSDGVSWEDSLHNVHRNIMLDGDCETCHSSVDTAVPVLLGSSVGGAGLEAIGCAGCHGRAEDVDVPRGVGYGAGLRQHHWRAGEEICLDCHADTDPEVYTPVDESFLPPYYSDSDAAHPDMPSGPCNRQSLSHPEDYAGSILGLDNDGNGFYDEADTSACPTPAPTAAPIATPAATPTPAPTAMPVLRSALQSIVSVATTVDTNTQRVRLDFTGLPPSYEQIRLEGVTALYWCPCLDTDNPSSLKSTGFTVNGSNLEMQYEESSPPSTNYITYKYLDGYDFVDVEPVDWIVVTDLGGGEQTITADPPIKIYATPTKR
jgi:hypothetical protein